MLGISKAPIVAGLESVLFRVKATLSPQPIGRGECIGVIFQNPLLDVDGETPNTAQVWIGNSTDIIWLLIPGQESPLIYAEDLKDIYVKLLFPFPNPNGIITAAGPAPGGRGTGYTTGDVITILTTGDAATLEVTTAQGAVTAATIQAAGAGYVLGDVLTLSATGGAQITVTGVDGGGAITGFDITAPGTIATLGVVPCLGGSGAGATVNITEVVGQILTLTVITGGTQFVEGDDYPAFFGTGEGAIVRVTVVEDTVPSVCNLAVLMYRQRKGGKQ